MAEYVALSGSANAGEAIVLTDSTPCTKRLIIHRNDSGILTIRGRVENPCSQFARYEIKYFGNIAVAEGGTPGEISLAIAVGGEVLPITISRVTPTVAGAYFAVSSARYLEVPAGCCYNVSVVNNSDQAIDYNDLNVIVTRISA